MTKPTSSIVPPACYRAHLYRRSFGHLESIVTRTQAVNALASLFGTPWRTPEYIEAWNRPHPDISAPWRVWVLPDLIVRAAADNPVGSAVYQNESYRLVTNIAWAEAILAPKLETPEQLLAAAKVRWPRIFATLVEGIELRVTGNLVAAEEAADVAMLAFYQQLVEEGSL